MEEDGGCIAYTLNRKRKKNISRNFLSPPNFKRRKLCVLYFLELEKFASKIIILFFFFLFLLEEF